MTKDCAVCHVDFARTLADTDAVDRSLSLAAISNTSSELGDYARRALERSVGARLCQLCHRRLSEK